MRTWAAMRYGSYSHRYGMGNTSSIVAQLSQYSTDEILSAFQTLKDTFAGEQQQYEDMVQWASPQAGNIQNLTPDGRAQFLDAIQLQTDVVNGLQDKLSLFSSVLQTIGIGGDAVAVPGLTGFRRMRGLGIIPVIPLAVVASIIAIVIGVGVYEHYQAESQQANAQSEQAKTMTTVASQVPQLIAQGWTPQQIQSYIQSINAGQSSQKNWASEIPWTTLGVITGAVLLGKSIFG